MGDRAGGIADLDEIEGLIVKLLGHAELAKAYDRAIRREPGLAAGFGKMQERHRAAVQTLCAEIGEAAGSMASAAAPFSEARRQGSA